MKFSESDISDLADILKDVGRREIVSCFLGVKDAKSKQKSAAWDVVTQADIAAEQGIGQAIRQRYPQARIVGEEAAAADPSSMEGLDKADLAFVIDPIDGTYNFASGMPVFGSILAIVVGGECVAGIIHYPIGGETLIGVAGAGSRLVDGQGVGVPVKVADPVPLEQMIGTVSWGFMGEPERSRVAGGLSKIGMPFGFRCSAWEYRLVATGRAHFISAHKLMPWDHLAGVLIHAEAGGYSACIDGQPYGPGITEGGLITAVDRDSWEMVRKEIFGA
ncbi:MAG: inositol monophosphatase [Pseudomonadota bacterium]